ncbi:MAG: sulfite exporter TauE/SafE family protein [Deltaproteobacteria bacterium]|nr:sulfite exporter TauE/SafE family protein [Deltaproteobacteria bacterium]
MYFPVSGVEVNPLLPVLVALVVSTFTSMGGISGAFLLLPFQLSVLNFTAVNLSPTNLVFNIIAIPSGVYRYIREGRMNWPLTYVTILGTLPGLYFGALLREGVLRYQANFKLFVGLVLIYIGGRLLYDQTAWARRKKAKIQEFESQVQNRLRKVLDEAGYTTGKGLPPAARVRTTSWSLTRISYEFLGETFTFNVPALFILALVVGLIGGAYGIGGGSIIAPFLAAIFGLPVFTIAGAALFGTLVTSVAGVGIYYLRGFPPDWALGALFGIGGFMGMYLGARLQRFFSGRVIRIGLGLVISALALRYIIGYFLR